VFEQADVSGHQCRREKTEDLPEGKVPRHHREDNAEGIPADVAVIAVGRNLFGRENACGVLGVIATGSGAFQHLLARGVERLAHLFGNDGGKVFRLVLEDRRELAHAQSAMFERNALVGAECFRGEGDLLTDGSVVEWTEAAKQLAVGGIDRFDGHVSGSVDPDASLARTTMPCAII
jgi:hypothetical protein